LSKLAATKTEAQWKVFSRLSHGELDPPCLSWLLDSSSLTRRLINSCQGQFAVEVVSEQWLKPMRSEQIALGLRRANLARVREVRLLCDGIPWVFARTVIPYSTLQGPVRRLSMLGNKSLGAVMFADPSMRRGELEIASFTKSNLLYQPATCGLRNKPAKIWGRRSVFYLSGKPLLVNEIFLPQIGKKKF